MLSLNARNSLRLLYEYIVLSHFIPTQQLQYYNLRSESRLTESVPFTLNYLCLTKVQQNLENVDCNTFRSNHQAQLVFKRAMVYAFENYTNPNFLGSKWMAVIHNIVCVPTAQPTIAPSNRFSTEPTASPSYFTISTSIIPTVPPTSKPCLMPSSIEIKFWANWTIPCSSSMTTFEQKEFLDQVFLDAVNALRNATSLNAVTNYLQQIARSDGVAIMVNASSSTSKNTSQLIYSVALNESPPAMPVHTITLSTADVAGIYAGAFIFGTLSIILLFIYARRTFSKKNNGLKEANAQVDEADPEELVNSSLFEYFSRKETLHAHQLSDGYESFTVTLQTGVTRNEQVVIPNFNWSDVVIDSQTRFLGAGNFGRVIQVCLLPLAASRCGLKQRRIVALKIIVLPRNDQAKADDMISKAKEEVAILISAVSKIVDKSCVVRMYGICTGEIPKYICGHSDLNLANGTNAVGILMRLESGGTLSSRIYPQQGQAADSSKINELHTAEKLRILSGVARGISELHAAGIIHGDIKPDNVLLSSHRPALIRLADFGLSRIVNSFRIEGSLLSQTIHFKGTPVYAAPEMLVNPHGADFNTNDVLPSKATRKTDVYAFAILCWEVLSQEVPFKKEGIKSVLDLAGLLYQGFRPDIDEVPVDCPEKVKLMIQKCWSTDRVNRLTALQCYSILQGAYDSLISTDSYDVCLCYHWKSLEVAEYVAYHLSRFGLKIEKVCPNEYEIFNDVSSDGKSIYNPVRKSKAVVVFASPEYHSSDPCMNFLLAMAEIKMKAKNAPLAVFVDPSKSDWVEDFEIICQLGASRDRAYDLSSVAGISWDTVGDDYASNAHEETFESVNQQINTLAKKLLDIRSNW